MGLKLILVFLLGAWSGGTLFMWSVAMQNFAVVNNILEGDHDGVRQAASSLEPGGLRSLLRYQASEVNRLFFEKWGLVQLPVAAIVMILAWKQDGKFIPAAALVMLLICLALQFYVVPETIRLGRIMDFLPREPAPPEAATFWRLHHSYTGLDMLKFLLGIASMGVLVRKIW